MGLLMRKRKKVAKPVSIKRGGFNVNVEQKMKKFEEDMQPRSMDMHGMGKFLCVGDFISLYCEETEGYVFSAQSSSTSNGLCVYSSQDRDRPRNIPNPQAVVFQVTIQNRYKLNKKWRKLETMIGDEVDVPETAYSRVTRHKIQSSAEAENKDNEAEQKRQFGKKVRYGEIIQLRHAFSGKFIHSSTTQTSQKDKNNMKILLLDYNAKNAQFKILPRYKVKSEGEFVQMYDQVMLESIKSPGHYLHVSEPYKTDHFTISCELNLGVERSSFTLMGCFRDYPEQSLMLRGGSVVRLFHKELEAYVIAKGLFDYCVTENVHCHIRAFDPYNPKTISPSTSGITYWQVEAESSILNGDVIKWEQQIRLRHMTTRRYLALDNNLDVCLLEDNSDPRTVFRFHSVVKEMNEIKFESYTRIEHMLTGCWLHALKDHQFERNTIIGTISHFTADTPDVSTVISDGVTVTTDGTTEGATVAPEIATDTSKLRHLLASNESMYADAYTLQWVPIEDVHNFNYVAGYVPFLRNLIADMNSELVITARDTFNILMAMKEMKCFLVKKGEPVKKRQKLLRNLKVIDLLVELVKCPLKTGEEQLHRIRIFKEAYDVLHSYMLGRSGKNALYMAKYIDFFQTQFTQKGGIGINVAQMIVELMRDKRKLVDRISKHHIDRFLDLLGETQNSIFLNLLQVLCVCDGVAIQDNQIYITDKWLKHDKGYRFHTARGQNLNMEPNMMFLSTDCKDTWSPMHKMDPSDANDDTYQFLLHQLDLLKALCYGRNDFAVHAITREKSILMWEDAYLCLTSDKFPDQLRAKFCEVIIAAFVDVGSNYSVLDQPELCFMYEFVGTKSGEREASKNAQDLATLFPVLRDFIIEYMEHHKQMVASDIGQNQLTEQVLCLLKHLVRFGYFSDLDDINVIITPLMSIIDGTTDVPFPKDKPKGYTKESQKSVYQYRSGGRYEKSVETEAIVNAKYQGLEILDFLLTFQRNLRLKKMVERFKIIENDQLRTNRMAAMMYSSYNARDTNKKVLRRQKKIIVEIREIFHESDIFDKDNYTQILMDTSEYQYDKMVTKSLDILNKAYSSQSGMFKLAQKTRLLLTPESVSVHLEIQKELPVLQRFIRQKANDYQIGVMEDILERFISMCLLQKDSNEAHFINQRILVSHGIQSVILEILGQEVNIDTECGEEGQRGMAGVFSRTLRLIKVLATDNKEVQEDMFYHLDVLLEVTIVPSDLAMALKEVRKMVNLMCEFTDTAPEFIDLLHTIVKVEGLDLNIKRNQALVMKFLMQNYQNAAYVLEKCRDERELILTKDDDNLSHLSYFIRFVDLLAVCAEGENKFIESLCQTMLPIEELLWIMNHQSIDNVVKTPFIKFLHEVYLQFVGDIIESAAADIQHHRDMWDFLDELTRTIGRTVSGIETHKNSLSSSMKEKVDISFLTKDITSVDKLFGDVIFLLEGILPFLKTYFTRVYSAEKDLYPGEIDTTNRIALAVAGFCDTIAPYLSNPLHMRSMVTCLGVLIPLSTEPTSIFDKVMDRVSQSLCIDQTRSDLKKGNMAYYTAELQLNDKFHTFTKNCNIINRGQNTVKAQIGYNSKREYTSVGASDEMPLGEEFHSLVKCFVNHKEKKPHKKYCLVSKLIQQLQISAKLFTQLTGAEAEYDDLDIRCLQILRSCVHNEERRLPEDFDGRAGETKVKRQLLHIKDVQNAINDKDFVGKVLPHIARRNDGLAREVLGFLSGMLLNANRDVQKSMLQYFLSTKEELFFMALRERMVIASNSIKEKRSLLAQHEAKATESDEKECASVVGVSILQMIQSYDGRLKRERFHGWSMLGRSAVPLSRKKKKDIFSGNSSTSGGSTYQNEKLDDLSVFQGQDSNVDDDDDALSAMMQYNDDGYIELVVSLLARICDGQNAALQNYLREQPDNVKSFNIVAETTQFLNVVYSSVNRRTIDLVVKAFSCLNEFCAGNQENRVVLYGNKIVDYINFILRSGDVSDCPPEKVLDLRQIIGNLILSLIEENGPEKTEVALEVKDTVDKRALLQCMTNCYKMFQCENVNLADIAKVETGGENESLMANVGRGFLKRLLGKKDDPIKEKIADTGFLYYLIWARMTDLDPVLETKMKISVNTQKAIDYYKKSCLSIEVVKDDVLQKVNFQVENKNLLREEVKENLKWNVDRSSPSNKIRDLMGWTKDILKDISYQRKILQKPISKIFTKLWLLWNHGAFFLSVAINMLMLYTWNAKASLEDYQKITNATIDWTAISDPGPRIGGLDKDLYHILMYALSGTHNFFSLMVLISYILLNHPRLPTTQQIKDTFSVFSKKKDKIEEEPVRKDDTGGSRLDARIFSFQTFYYLMFLATSVLGTVYHGYFFSFHLLNIVVNNQLLSGVIKAVTQNGWSLFWVAILGLIVIYIYALIGFSLLRAFFDPSNYLYCHTLWQCTVTVVRYGLIGDMFGIVGQQDDQHTDFVYFWPLVLYHVSFFILITTVGLNIIFGIIVDTFSELRDLKWQSESDMRECCFICSRNSYDFEHTGKGFQHHILHEHSMWSYIYFFIHLDNTNPSDYTALELHCATQWKKENFDFFPLNRALCLVHLDADANETKIEEVLKKVEGIQRKQMEEELEKKRKKEKLRQKKWHQRHRLYVFDASKMSENGSPLRSRERTPKTDTQDKETETDQQEKLSSDEESLSGYDETPKRRRKSMLPPKSDDDDDLSIKL